MAKIRAIKITRFEDGEIEVRFEREPGEGIMSFYPGYWPTKLKEERARLLWYKENYGMDFGSFDPEDVLHIWHPGIESVYVWR